MAGKRVFIGSARESKELAQQLAQGLAASGFVPLRWWLEFPAGEFTLDTLQSHAARVDAAILICSGDDKRWYRGNENQVPRDNVILEYGVFLSHVGRQRTLIIKGPNVQLPSDLEGLGFHDLHKDRETVVEKATQHFLDVFKSHNPQIPDALPLAVDAGVVDQMFREQLPHDWHQRCLYFGTEGAKGWMAATADPDYFPFTHKKNVEDATMRAIKDVDVRSYVSMGPGDAQLDTYIAMELKTREAWLAYVPVDISEGLLQRAIQRLSERVRVPIGILTDFEDRPRFIERQLHQHAGRPALFSLLGNTFGNLDLRERSFLQSMRSLMGPEDLLLIDACIMGRNWSPELHRRNSPARYSSGERRWLATGLARQTGESIEKIVDEFEARIVFTKGLSDVPGAYAKNIQDQKSGKIVYTFRRYDWEALKQWLEEVMSFKVLADERVEFDDVTGDGVLLLQRSSRGN